MDNLTLEKVPRLVESLDFCMYHGDSDVRKKSEVRELCDLQSVGGNELDEDIFDTYSTAKEAECLDGKPPTLTTGKDWVGEGWDEGPQIGEFIRQADELRDRYGVNKEQAMRMIIADVTK